jgi:hypothetical protein
MEVSLTYRHVKLGKMDQKDQDLAALIHESYSRVVQIDLMDQNEIHEIHEIHAKSS